jgi:hypothetical protein
MGGYMTLTGKRFNRNKDIRCAGCAIHKARLVYLAYGTDLLGTRFILGLSSLAWAIMLLWPGALFPTAAQITAGTGRTTYAIMAMAAGELYWATAFAVQGIVTLLAIVYDLRTRLVLWVEGILGCLLWTAATISCFVSHFRGWDTYQPPAAMAAELMLTVGAWWVLVRYKVEDEHGA